MKLQLVAVIAVFMRCTGHGLARSRCVNIDAREQQQSSYMFVTQICSSERCVYHTSLH